MKLMDRRLGLEMNLEDNVVTVITIESPAEYACFVRNLWNQSNGEDGDLLLFSNEKEKSIQKDMELIFNPFNLQFNQKKVINKLYQEIQYNVEEGLIDEITELNSSILNFLKEATNALDYPVQYDCEMHLSDLLKIYSVEPVYPKDSLIDAIALYLELMNRICHIHCFVFVGLKQYLSSEELIKLYEFAVYEKVMLLLVESSYKANLDLEKNYILDQDLCIIEI